jgi:AraC family transcriptional regulator of adaptative response / DNA-3-methyladenine glycosylase II
VSDFRWEVVRRAAMMAVVDAPTITAEHGLDPERCYRAMQSRDARFDGWFVVAVSTTGIYCRPSCPAITPKRRNVSFYRTAAAAQQRGFRACKRCRPDATPGSPEWNVRGDVVARAMRLIADGVVDRDGVAGLARRLGYSERHLSRLVTDELGAGPLAVARAQRAQTARLLLEATDMAITDVAFAAGFGSVRQFNDTIREVFAEAPSVLRQRRRSAGGRVDAGSVVVRLATRVPFDAASVFEFLGSRAVPGVEHWDGQEYRRSLVLPNGQAVAAITAGDGCVHAAIRLDDVRDLAPAVQRLRRLLDLDADPVAIDDVLGADPVLGPIVAIAPGRRSPGAVDASEIVVRAIVGQQVSVAGARTIIGRLAAGVGDALTIADEHITRAFPTPAAMATIADDLLPMPMARRRTLREANRRIAAGELPLDPGCDRDAAVAALLTVPGVGPWTAAYVAMRGLADPDVMLPTDLGVRHAFARLGLDDAPRHVAAVATRWRPWRSYALHHLWSTL